MSTGHRGEGTSRCDGPSRTARLREAVVLKERSWGPGFTTCTSLPVTESGCCPETSLFTERGLGTPTAGRLWASHPKRMEGGLGRASRERRLGGCPENSSPHTNDVTLWLSHEGFFLLYALDMPVFKDRHHY